MDRDLLILLSFSSLVSLFVFAAPMSRAFLRGIGSARVPKHRKPPKGEKAAAIPAKKRAWHYFHQTVSRRAVSLSPIWLLILGGLFGLGFFGNESGMPWRCVALDSLKLPGLMAAFWAFSLIGCLIWAPICDHRSLLVPFVWITALILYAASLLTLSFWMPDSWETVSFKSATGQEFRAEISFTLLAAAAGLAAFLYWLLMRLMGDWWFRFDR